VSVTALIVAAGKGKRFGGQVPKQYRLLGAKSVLRRAVEALAAHPSVAKVRIVIGAGQEELAREALAGLDVGPLIQGGAERADSVRAGLSEVDGEAVLVHDAARPFCPHPVIDRLLAPLEFFDGAAPVLAVRDTLARAGARIDEPVERSGIVRVQTPQAFRLASLRQAYESWPRNGAPTDETTVARAAGLSVAAVEGDALLEKITTAADFQRAEQWLASVLVPRTGIGFDVHAFAGDGPIMLGGIELASDRGLAGHSDADVALHAITDALLGAAGLGDIGEHFPPTDAQWKDASSDRFLAHAAALIRERGGIIDNVDCTIICEQPKIGPHRETMRQRIAQILRVRGSQVSIKATTTEGLGFAGRGEGIAAQAIATIRLETSE
jgi:2-C-methyl-D-erythritol 4-phosphate cytidylyltransferase/2-C-methyl-D-erythritol 2,4-cyclodiphosphate synthase